MDIASTNIGTLQELKRWPLPWAGYSPLLILSGRFRKTFKGSMFSQFHPVLLSFCVVYLFCVRGKSHIQVVGPKFFLIEASSIPCFGNLSVRGNITFLPNSEFFFFQLSCSLYWRLFYSNDFSSKDLFVRRSTINSPHIFWFPPDGSSPSQASFASCFHQAFSGVGQSSYHFRPQPPFTLSGYNYEVGCLGCSPTNCPLRWLVSFIYHHRELYRPIWGAFSDGLLLSKAFILSDSNFLSHTTKESLASKNHRYDESIVVFMAQICFSFGLFLIRRIKKKC